MTQKSQSGGPSPRQAPAPSAGPPGEHATTARRTDMPDDDHLQVNIFQPRVSADQHRLGVRFDALRGALGKLGRPFSSESALILPAPVLHLDPHEMWEPYAGDCRSRRAWLVFAYDIKGAHTVTLWDAQRHRVGDAHQFFANTPIPVDDPGEGGSVEVRNGHRVTFKVGVPVRTFDVKAGAEPYQEAYEAVPAGAYEQTRAGASEESGAETPKE